MKPQDYRTFPSLKQFLEDGGLKDVDGVVEIINRLCEVAHFDPESLIRDTAKTQLRRTLPFEPVLEVLDGQLHLRAPNSAFRIYIGDVYGIGASYFNPQ